MFEIRDKETFQDGGEEGLTPALRSHSVSEELQERNKEKRNKISN